VLVAQVAQRHDVTRQQIYAWRHELKRKGLWSPISGALFLPVDAPPISNLPVLTDPAPVPAVWIELRLAKGRVLRFESDIAEAALTLERIANQWPSANIDALMPWNYRN